MICDRFKETGCVLLHSIADVHVLLVGVPHTITAAFITLKESPDPECIRHCAGLIKMFVRIVL